MKTRFSSSEGPNIQENYIFLISVIKYIYTYIYVYMYLQITISQQFFLRSCLWIRTQEFCSSRICHLSYQMVLRQGRGVFKYTMYCQNVIQKNLFKCLNIFLFSGHKYSQRSIVIYPNSPILYHFLRGTEDSGNLNFKMLFKICIF